MFTNISWTSFIAVVTLLLALWYLIIGIRFYFHDLHFFLVRKKNPPFQPASDTDNPNKGSEFSPEQTYALKTDNLFKEVEKLTAKLKETIADAYSKNYHSEEFTFLLQLTLKEYPLLKGSPFQVAINNLIILECEKYGYLHLSAEELVMLWKEVA